MCPVAQFVFAWSCLLLSWTICPPKHNIVCTDWQWLFKDSDRNLYHLGKPGIEPKTLLHVKYASYNRATVLFPSSQPFSHYEVGKLNCSLPTWKKCYFKPYLQMPIKSTYLFIVWKQFNYSSITIHTARPYAPQCTPWFSFTLRSFFCLLPISFPYPSFTSACPLPISVVVTAHRFFIFPAVYTLVLVFTYWM